MERVAKDFLASIRLFWRVFRLSLRMQLTYRTAIIAGLVTNVCFGLLRAAFFTALYAGRNDLNGLSLPEALTFVAFSQALIAFLALFSWSDLMQTVYSGSIATDLLKPQRLFSFWLAREAGRGLVNLFGRGVVLLALYAPFYPLVLPTHPGQWLAVCAALSLAWLVSFAWRFLVNLSAFWTPEARGVIRLGMTATLVLSGFYMPLHLLPDWFQRLAALTPFPAMIQLPLDVFLGRLEGGALLQTFASQALWFLILMLLAELVLRLGVRRLVIQGG